MPTRSYRTRHRTTLKRKRTITVFTLKQKIQRLLYKIKKDNQLDAFYHLTLDEQNKFNKEHSFLLPLMRMFPNQLDEIVTRCMEPSLTENYTFMILAIKNTPDIMQYASYELCENMDFIMDAYYTNSRSILYLPQEIYDSFPHIKKLYEKEIHSHNYPYAVGEPISNVIAEPLLTYENMFTASALPHVSHVNTTIRYPNGAHGAHLI